MFICSPLNDGINSGKHLQNIDGRRELEIIRNLQLNKLRENGMHGNRGWMSKCLCVMLLLLCAVLCIDLDKGKGI